MVIGSFNYHTVSIKGNIVGNNRGFSAGTQFWSAVMLIISQCLLIAQWAAFDDIRALSFAQYEAQFTWRCLGGEMSEYVMLRSCAFVGILTVITVAGAIFRCSTKDFHAVVLSLNVWSINAAIWYFAPELNFQFRDLAIGILLLTFSLSTLISSYCFSPSYPVVELSTATMSSTLMDDNRRGTLRRKTQFIEQEQEYRTLGRNYATMQQPKTLPKSSTMKINSATT
uniref:G_PROTEIN_RECEP_F3_4 domain-containing protein n=1 Tax=Bursaphelenchus xylophilus TaxID=6326 RepID=A0A1I7RUX3_BURXY